MNERLSIRMLAELLAERTELDLQQAEGFIDALASYITQGIENNKAVKVFGLGVFKIVLVRDRESVHIQTGERFRIPAHHKLSFIPDKSFKECVNHRNTQSSKPIPVEIEEKIPKKVVINRVAPLSEAPVAEEAHEEPMVLEAARKNTDVQDHQVNLPDDMDMKEIHHVSALPEEFDLPISKENPVSSVYEQLLEELADTTKKPIPISADEDSDALELEFTVAEINHAEDLPQSDPVTVMEEEVEVDMEDDFDTTQVAPELEIEPEIETKPEVEEVAAEPEVKVESESEVNEPVKEEIHLENEDETAAIDSETEKVIPSVSDEQILEKKKKFLLLWFLLLPLLILISIFSATYAFLHYHRPIDKEKAYVANQGMSATNGVEQAMPFPIGVMPAANGKEQTNVLSEVDVIDIDEDVEHLIDTIAEMSVSEIGNEGDKNKKEEKIDWLAPPPENPNQETSQPTEKQTRTETEKKDKSATTEAAETTKKAAETAKPENNTPEKKIPAKVRMGQGSSLTQIAMEYYGDKIFWVYIYEHNKSRIKNFDKIPAGTELRLPSPKTYNIDAKNNASVQKARKIQSELMKWDNWDDYR